MKWIIDNLRLAISPRAICRYDSQSIIVVSTMHAYQMALMLSWPDTAGATCVRSLFDILRLVVPEDGVAYIYVAVFGALVLALIGALCDLGWVRLAILIPQQAVLAGMAWGGIIATIHGRYLDGTPIPSPHISADQIGYVALCAIHLLAILHRARDRDG